MIRLDALPYETEEEIKQRLQKWFDDLTPERKQELFNISPQPMSVSFEVAPLPKLNYPHTEYATGGYITEFNTMLFPANNNDGNNNSKGE
jgi:hypothetical protein